MTPSNDANHNDESESEPDCSVGSLVAKAKRAAASLWMVLHAQGCHATGNNCPYQGCEETKKILLHVKRCSMSTPGSTKCPENFNGCCQVKKLMAHYYRCRALRASKAVTSTGPENKSSCLLCTFVARHAQNVRKRNVCSVASFVKPNVSNKRVTFQSDTSNNFSMTQEKMIPNGYVSVDNNIDRKTSSELMPPPPPRLSAVRQIHGNGGNAMISQQSCPILRPISEDGENYTELQFTSSEVMSPSYCSLLRNREQPMHNQINTRQNAEMSMNMVSAREESDHIIEIPPSEPYEYNSSTNANVSTHANETSALKPNEKDTNI